MQGLNWTEMTRLSLLSLDGASWRVTLLIVHEIADDLAAARIVGDATHKRASLWGVPSLSVGTPR